MKNKGNIKEQKCRYREKYPEKVREQKRAQKKRRRERLAALRLPKPPKQLSLVLPRKKLDIPFPYDSPEYSAAYYQLNKDRIRIVKAKWRQENRERRGSYRNARRAKVGASEHYGKAFIQKLFKDQQGACPYCQTSIQDSFHVDHIIPLSKGGTHTKNNLQLLCPPCNLRKSDSMPEVFLSKISGDFFSE